MAVDIEGNCRFYDLVRLKKIGKVLASTSRDADARFNQHKFKWRLLPSVCMEVGADAFLAVTQTLESPLPDDIKQSPEEYKESPKYLIESKILVEKEYSDVKEKLKGIRKIQGDSAELPFYLNKSTLNIFRFEDVVLNLFPQFGNLKKKGTTAKEIFLKNDPN